MKARQKPQRTTNQVINCLLYLSMHSDLKATSTAQEHFAQLREMKAFRHFALTTILPLPPFQTTTAVGESYIYHYA